MSYERVRRNLEKLYSIHRNSNITNTSTVEAEPEIKSNNIAYDSFHNIVKNRTERKLEAYPAKPLFNQQFEAKITMFQILTKLLAELEKKIPDKYRKHFEEFKRLAPRYIDLYVRTSNDRGCSGLGKILRDIKRSAVTGKAYSMLKNLFAAWLYINKLATLYEMRKDGLISGYGAVYKHIKFLKNAINYNVSIY